MDLGAWTPWLSKNGTWEEDKMAVSPLRRQEKNHPASGSPSQKSLSVGKGELLPLMNVIFYPSDLDTPPRCLAEMTTSQVELGLWGQLLTFLLCPFLDTLASKGIRQIEKHLPYVISLDSDHKPVRQVWLAPLYRGINMKLRKIHFLKQPKS